MGSCISKNLLQEKSLKDCHRLDPKCYVQNAVLDEKRTTYKGQRINLNTESSFSLATCVCTYDSLNEEERKEKLYELVYNRLWYDAFDLMKECANHRIADYVDMYQRTGLHWAVIKRAPANLIKSILKLNNDATTLKDYTGRTPIHLAVEHSSDSIVQLLLDATDKNVYAWRDFKNMRCLLSEAIVCDRSCIIVNAILQADMKQIDLIDCDGNTPLVLFFRKNLGKMLFLTNTCGVFKSQAGVDEIVEIASLLLQAEYSTSSGRQPTVNDSVLNMAIANKSTPSQFVKLIIQEYPNQTKIHRNGNYPIHVACMCNDQLMECYKCDSCSNVNSNNQTMFFHRDGVARVLCQDCITEMEKDSYVSIPPGEMNTNIINLLLTSSESDSEKRNSKNKLPLHLALSSGRNWYDGGIKALVEANPRALSCPDPSSGLLPFVLAASKCNGNDDSAKAQLTTIYELLVRWPMSECRC